MQQMTRKVLGNGVRLTCVSTEKFKTSVVGASLVLPLGRAAASELAVLPSVLRRGTREYPDMRAIGNALDELYGARVVPAVRKCGECVVLSLVSDVIDEKYAAPDGGLTAKAVALLSSMMKDPYLPEGTFCKEYVEGERENLADRIAARRDDPRSYALYRLYECMCQDETFGQSELGDIAGARKVQADMLHQVYEAAMEGASIELFYCGSLPMERVEQEFAGLSGRRASDEVMMPQTRVLREPAKAPRFLTETMDVQQGKLSLGFRTSITAADDAYPALMLMNTIYGGSTSSKLFLNVREKMSLCYYASSLLEKHKGIMAVSSGIENENYEVARDEILRQFDKLQKGDVTQDEMEASRLTLISALHEMSDSPLALENFWLGQSIAGLRFDVDMLIERIRAVTRDEVVAAANQVKLDTVYFLKGVQA